MADRACQAVVKLALEPEWEAKFEPNSYGFRPGRSAHDAIAAIFCAICRKAKLVYDADIEKCFDRIDRQALLDKIQAPHFIKRLIRDWLEAGILDNGQWLYPEAGTPQGGARSVSPLLAAKRIALHGFEKAIKSVSKKYRIIVIRYADDGDVPIAVIICEDLETLKQAIACAEKWLAGMGLKIKASKSRITHTLEEYEGNVGFDFLGFNVRQYTVGQYRTTTYRGRPGYKTLIKPSAKGIKRHIEAIGEMVGQHSGAPQAELIAKLNPVIRGWALYYRTCVAKHTFSKIDKHIRYQLIRWARRRHPGKTPGWRRRRYWRRQEMRDVFSDGKYTLNYYRDMPIRRHVKVRGDKSPYDGDWVYWSERMGRDPTRPRRITKLLKEQKGRCGKCGLHFWTEDVIEVHHRDGNRENHRYTNLVLLHGHCHDQTPSE